MSRDSSVGVATRYGLDGPGIECTWEARFSAPVQTSPGANPTSSTMGTGSYQEVKRMERGAGPQWPVIGRNFTFTFTVK